MATYTNWQQRQLDTEEPKREPAVPTQSFEDWLCNQFNQKERDAIEDLTDEGLSEDVARDLVRQMIEDGEL